MKFKRLMNAVVAVAMVGINIFNGILPVLAAGEEDPTIQNPDPVTLDDGVVLSKTVKSVEGYANKWEVTLRIESPKVEKTSDTVIVIDRSGSMGGNSGRLTAAKSAARSLAQQLLPSGNTTNRVAVVSFASSATSGTDFTTSYDTVSSVIGQMSARGGTFTQSAIRMAADLLKNSTADIKTMILLSDGEPTYSYPFTRDAREDDDNFVAYGQALETSSEVEQSVFSYSATGSVGDGSNLRQCMEYDGWNCVKYYNNGNSAIAEAGYFKDSGNGDLYTIALEAGDVGTPILNAIASPGKHYTATPSELTTIFNQIGGNILSLVQNASVEDTMGHGVKVSGTDGTTIEWDPVVFTLQGNVFVAEKSYIVEMDENVYDQTSADGFYALNESAVLTYNDGKTGEFPIPKAKPFDLDVEKELYVDGSKKDNEEFKFKVSSNGDEEVYTIKSGSHHKIPIPMPIKLGEEYTVTEVGVGSSNEIPFEYYDEPEYTVIYNGEEQAGSNKFIVTKNHGDEINVKIKNNYESAAVSASKVWDDNSDQDGLRKNYNDLWVVVKDEGSGKYVSMKKLATVDQSYSFSGLHKNRNGSPISYKVVEASGCEEDNNGTITCEEVYDGNNGEVSIDDDYTVEVGENNVITNAHTPATVKITVNKDWDDDNNRDGLRTDNKPVEFCVTGKVNGETVYEKTCKTASSLLDEIEIEFTGLPKYDNGEEIEYMVEESEFLGYNAIGLPESAFTVEDEEDVNVTNVHTPEKINILIQKVWDDSDNNDGKRPDQISATLTGGDEDVPVTIKESDSVEGKCEEWCVEVTDLYKNKQGSAIEYNVTENDLGVDGYTLKSIEGDAENGFTITNTYEPETVTVSVDKSWNDDNNRDGLRTDSSTVTFCVTGYAGDYTTEPVCKTVLTGVGLKTDLVTFTGLLKYHDGDELNYEVTEVNTLDGYTSDLVAGEYVVITDGEGTKEVTNTYDPKKINILIQKVWDDEDDQDGSRPDEITVVISGDDEDVTLTIDADSAVEGKCEEWCVEATDLHKNKDGEEIEYSVTENEVAGYETEIEGDAENGFTITNSHTPEPEPEPEDPCEKGGCGGVDTTPVSTPETGQLGKSENGSAAEAAWINNAIGGAMMVLLGVSLFAVGRRKNIK